MWQLGDVLFLYTDEEKKQFVDKGFDAERVFAANNTIGTDDIKQALTEWPPQRLSAFKAEHRVHDASSLLLFGSFLAYAIYDRISVKQRGGRRFVGVDSSASSTAGLRAAALPRRQPPSPVSPPPRPWRRRRSQS